MIVLSEFLFIKDNFGPHWTSNGAALDKQWGRQFDMPDLDLQNVASRFETLRFAILRISQ